MLLRCTGRLSALTHTLKSTDWFLVLVTTNGLRDVPSAARSFHRGFSPALLDSQRPLTAFSLLGPARCHQRGSDGLFTACPRISMQTRSSSTSQRSDGSSKAEVVTLKGTSSAEKSSGGEEPEDGKPNKREQLKKVFKEYGAVGVSFHVGISLMSLGMFYLLVSSGIDMASILCKLGFSEAVVRSKMAAGTSTFVLAYAIHKLFVPVRMSITLVSVPLIVRYFRKTGLFKAPPAAP